MFGFLIFAGIGWYIFNKMGENAHNQYMDRQHEYWRQANMMRGGDAMKDLFKK